MGNFALESAVENWFLHGNGADKVFNLTLLAAADCPYDAFDLPPPGGFSRLANLSDRVSIYFSDVDDVLKLSMVLNFAKRLGQDGPHNMADATEFPRNIFAMVDSATASGGCYMMAGIAGWIAGTTTSVSLVSVEERSNYQELLRTGSTSPRQFGVLNLAPRLARCGRPSRAGGWRPTGRARDWCRICRPRR